MICEKMANSTTNTWLTDALTDEERKTAEFIASIAVSIQRGRHAQGLSQEELANKLGVSQATVSKWEEGDENFTAVTLVKISFVLGLPLCNPISA